MLDDLRNYLQMASGITEATTTKARETVSGLLAHGVSLSSKALPASEMMGQVQDLADDLVSTSRNNREMLVGMIRAEVDRAVGRMGFVREDELAALRRHVQRIEKQVGDLEAARVAQPVVVVAAPADAPAADAPVSDQPVAEQPVAEQPGAEEAPVAGAPADDAPAADAPADPPKRKKRILVVDQPEASA